MTIFHSLFFRLSVISQVSVVVGKQEQVSNRYQLLSENKNMFVEEYMLQYQVHVMLYTVPHYGVLSSFYRLTWIAYYV